MSKPNPQKAKQRLLKALKNNEPADQLLYEILKDASVTVAGITIPIWAHFNQNLKEYATVWLTLTSPEGRKYITKQMDKVFDYIEYLIRYNSEQP